MTILDGKNPRVHMTVPTADGRWMVAYVENGKPVVDNTFVGSDEDALAIAAALNRREMDRYHADSAKQLGELMPRPTLAEIARSLNIKMFETGGDDGEH